VATGVKMGIVLVCSNKRQGRDVLAIVVVTAFEKAEWYFPYYLSVVLE